MKRHKVKAKPSSANKVPPAAAKKSPAAMAEGAAKSIASKTAAKECQPPKVPHVERPTGIALPAPAVESAKRKIVESPKDVTWIHVPIKVLEACLLCAAKKDVRHYLEGVHIHGDKSELRVVATNGHALMLHSSPIEKPKDHDWLEGGIILPREELAIALGVFAKLKNFDDEPITTLQLGFGKGHGTATLRDAEHFATFKLPVVDGRFPDYQKAIESAGSVLSGGERQALSGTSINAEYLKIATVISAKFECKGITPFSLDEKSPAVVTFLGEPGALFIVMPISATTVDQLPVQTMALIGRGLEGSLAALKATNTRQRKQAAETKNEDERKSLEVQIAARDERIASVSQAIKGRLLQAPVAA